MKLHEYIDMPLLVTMMAEGYISKQSHPSAPLSIYNYTHAAQYDRVWNDATRKCRGLIVRDDGTIIARPWPKFFNYGEHTATPTQACCMACQESLAGRWCACQSGPDPYAPCVVTDKLDGSLGILYYEGDGYYSIATRGSFTSEQAIHATELLRGRYPSFVPVEGLTYLFEIIYPANRIVLDYGELDDLVLLGVVDTATGLRSTEPHVPSWPGSTARTFHYKNLAEALAAVPRPNAEGLVVSYPPHGLMLKIKQEDYVALHRIVTGLNERVVWERLGAGEDVADICIGLPDEFAEWVQDVRIGLQFRADHVYYAARDAFVDIIAGVSLCGNRDWTRKDFAMAAQEPEYDSVRPYLFLLLDDHTAKLKAKIWADIKPEGGKGPRVFGEATA